jgi:4-hydroxy-tetrahydrodipicolinate reductase
MTNPIPARTRTAHVGLGPIGLGVLRSIASRSWAQVVGGVDLRPELAGSDLGALAGTEPLGLKATAALGEVGPPGSADVVVLCTSSGAQAVEAQVLDALAWGAAVVTTCEELAYPWRHHPDVARRIDEAAKAAGRNVIATGINPGFAMDALALCLTGVAERVEGVSVRRVVDAATRRGPLQHKVGAGISPDEFEARRQARRIGHVGLVESAALIADGLGWELDGIEETLDPVIANRRTDTDVVSVEAGCVAGIRQVAVARAGGREVVRLDLEMYVGASDPIDRIEITGSPPLSISSPGFPGDACTAAITANAARASAGLPRGLLTALDLVPIRAYG